MSQTQTQIPTQTPKHAYHPEEIRGTGGIDRVKNPRPLKENQPASAVGFRNDCGSSKVGADARQVGGNHYKDMMVQPWDVMESVLTHDEFVGFLKGNIIKYSMRAGRKDAAELDAAKAAHYKQKLEELLTKL